ncbi:MAG: HDOD domain-containing protein [Candidatus Kryptoniota bacterium]
MIEVGQFTEKLSAIRELPTFPTIALEVMRLASDSDSSAAELARIVSKDQALSAKVLRVANSPFYGFTRKITTVEWAIVALGFETLRETVLSLTLIDLFKGEPVKGFDPRKFWKHALDTALIAKSIGRESGLRVPGEGYAAGLLHDIGTLVLYRFFRPEFQEIYKIIEEGKEQPLFAEETVLGANHADVGAWIAERWNFPPQLVEAIKFHHHPVQAKINTELTSVVHVANQIACTHGYSCSNWPLTIDFFAAEKIGLQILGNSLQYLYDKYARDGLTETVRIRVPVDEGVTSEYRGLEGHRRGLAHEQDPTDEEALKRFFVDAIKLLPTSERLVLTLKLYEGLDLHQVAVVLGYDEARVAEYYRNAVAVLQQMAEKAIITNRLEKWKTIF